MITLYFYGKLRDGDILLVPTNGVWQLMGDYQHAAMLWAHGQCRYIVEATPRRGVSASRFLPGRRLMLLRPTEATVEQGQAAAQAALQRLGESYGFGDLGAGLLRWWRRRGLRGLSAASVVCTNLVVAAWRVAGIDLTPGVQVPLPDDILAGPVKMLGIDWGGGTKQSAQRREEGQW